MICRAVGSCRRCDLIEAEVCRRLHGERRWTPRGLLNAFEVLGDAIELVVEFDAHGDGEEEVKTTASIGAVGRWTSPDTSLWRPSWVMASTDAAGWAGRMENGVVKNCSHGR